MRPGNSTFAKLLTLLLLLPCSCDRSGRGSSAPALTSREFWVNNFRLMLAGNHYPEQEAANIRALLTELETRNDPIPPRILYATAESIHATRRTEGGHFLVIDWYDETLSVCGFRIRESDTTGKALVEESYPLYIVAPTTFCDNITLNVRVRQAGERKDELAWQQYQERGIADKEHLPDVYLNMAAQPQSTELCLIDASEAPVSEWVPIKFIRPAPATRRTETTQPSSEAIQTAPSEPRRDDA
mgnify:CR=1 FL=1